MAESRVTSITAEVLATPVSEARVSFRRRQVLGIASSQVRVNSIALEALVSVAERPGLPTSSHNASIVMVVRSEPRRLPRHHRPAEAGNR